MAEERPWFWLIAGPNGAGKTTFAKATLKDHFGFVEFLNADELARGVSPVDPEAHVLEAGRLLLERRAKLVDARRSFAQETTLSSIGHLKFAKSLIGDGWQFGLFYVFLKSADQSMRRIHARVVQGGHNIPNEDAKRRYTRSLINLPKYLQ